MPVQHGVALDPKAPWGLFIAGTPPARAERKRKVLRFAPPKYKGFVGAFENDGEAIDFQAGPMNDWRSEDKDPDDLLKDLHVTTGEAALMEARNPQSNSGSIGMKFTVLTEAIVIMVGIMFLLAYLQKDGLPI